QSIAIALEKDIKPPRPLTHDLFKSFAEEFSITIKQVIIHKLVDGVFYSSLICERDHLEEIIDARTSDAVALALRFEAPIFTYKNILDKAGIQLKTERSSHGPLHQGIAVKPSGSKDKPASKSELQQKSIKELEEELKKAVKEENYE